MSDIQFRSTFRQSELDVCDVMPYDIPSDTERIVKNAFREWEKRRGIFTQPRTKLRGIALASIKRAEAKKSKQKKIAVRKEVAKKKSLRRAR